MATGIAITAVTALLICLVFVSQSRRASQEHNLRPNPESVACQLTSDERRLVLNFVENRWVWFSNIDPLVERLRSKGIVKGEPGDRMDNYWTPLGRAVAEYLNPDTSPKTFAPCPECGGCGRLTCSCEGVGWV